MGNDVNGMGQSVQSLTRLGNEVFAKSSLDGLQIFNVKPGDQIRISDISGDKYLSVNNKLIQLNDIFTYDRILISGVGLSRGTLDFKGEDGVSTVVRLLDQNGKLQEEFLSKNGRFEEETLVDKIVNSGIRGSISPTKITIGKEWKFY